MDIRSVRSLAQSAPAPADHAPSAENAKPVAPTAAVEAPRPAEPVDAARQMEQLKEALKSINETIQSMSPELEFTVDSESRRTIVKVVDQQTKQVLRQMPSEEALSIAKALDKLQGLLIKQKV